MLHPADFEEELPDLQGYKFWVISGQSGVIQQHKETSIKQKKQQKYYKKTKGKKRTTADQGKQMLFLVLILYGNLMSPLPAVSLDFWESQSCK